jgi:hypothetical protein
MLIERWMPEFDATRIEHRVVASRASDAYAATHALRGLLTVRAQRERLASVLRRSGSAVRARGPEALRLADLPAQESGLACRRPTERDRVRGGRALLGRCDLWEQIDASDFGAFARPGYAKIAANFSFRPYGEARTLREL